MINTKNHVIVKNILDYTLYDEVNVEKRIFVSWDFFELAAIDLYNKIREYEEKNRMKFENIYALPRGGLCLGVKLSYMMKLPIITDKGKIDSKTLVVDDCTDTGQTLSSYKDNITVVMFHKPSSSFKPNIFFKETEKQINFCWESKEERN
jgi:hypoxanthine phosphoribosyltransferase